MKITALAVIALGVFFAVVALFCFFAQKRVLEYFLAGNIRQFDLIRSNSWLLAIFGGLAIIFGLWGIVKRGSYSGPAWIFYVAVLAGIAIILSHKFMAQYQYDWYYRFWLQKTDGVVSWRPAAQWYTYVAGIVLSLASFVTVSVGVYNLRH